MSLDPILNIFISPAYAEAAPVAAQGGFVQFLPIIILFVLMYFILIRPQQKRAKEHRTMIGELNTGDEVVTNGGLLGKITEVGDSFFTVKLAADVEVQVQKNAIASLMPKGTLKKI